MGFFTSFETSVTTATDALGKMADAQQRVVDATNAVNMALAVEKDAAENVNRVMKETADSAKVATDAFGQLAGGLTEVSAQADHATDGLQGVNWEMVHATTATVSLTQSQKDLIQSLAKVSDAGGASSLWVGHLIAQLQNGEISFGDFTSKVNQLLQELSKLGPVMGNTAGELNAINTILSAFKNNSKDGWPDGTGPTGV